VTAHVSDYGEITIEVFLSMQGTLPFDVFIKLDETRILQIFKKGDKVNPERFRSYQEKGVNALYIHRSDRREYIFATERLLQKILITEPMNHPDAARAIEELSEQTLYEIYEDHIFDDHSFRRSQEVVKTYVQLLKKDIRTLTNFINLSKNESYMCRHSIATSVMAILIARADANINDRTLQIIGLGGLLHDLGMVRLPTELWDVDRRLTPEEWVQIKMHPGYSKELIKAVKQFPDEVLMVLEQHHESFDGSGYPRGLEADGIYYPARVVAIADAFSALTTRRGGRSLYKPDDALALLMTERNKYDPKLLAVFEKLLNPKKKAAA